jgi:hypothetical protein
MNGCPLELRYGKSETQVVFVPTGLTIRKLPLGVDLDDAIRDLIQPTRMREDFGADFTRFRKMRVTSPYVYAIDVHFDGEPPDVEQILLVDFFAWRVLCTLCSEEEGAWISE